MKRLLLTILLAALLLAGCGAPETDNQTTSGPQVAQGDTNGTVIGLGGDIHYTGDDSYLGSGTPEGFYILKTDYVSNIQNITYVDYATQKYVYLCSSPNCTHDTESCTSFIPFTGGIQTLVATPGKLFVIYEGNSVHAEELGNKAYPHIDVMEKNGSGCKTLVQFSAGDYISSGVAYDDTSLYLTKWHADEGEFSVDTKKELLSLNMQTGELKTVCTLNVEDYFTGVSGRALYLQRYLPGDIDQEAITKLEEKMLEMEQDPEAYTEEDWDTVHRQWEEIYDKSWDEAQTVVSSVNVDSGAVAELTRWQRSEVGGNWKNASTGIYYAGAPGQLLHRDYATNTETVLTTQFPNTAETDTNVEGIYGGWLLASCGRLEGENYIQTRYAVHQSSGEVRELTMKPAVVRLATTAKAQNPGAIHLSGLLASPSTPGIIFTNGAWEEEPIRVITQVEADKLLVVKKYELRTEMIEGKVGEMYPAEMETPCYALIKIEDFVNNNPAYMDVETIR